MNKSLALVLAVTLLVACAGNPVSPRRDSYTVRAGDTLYSIAWRNGLDYRELARLNGIGRDYTIYPGQVLRLRSTAHVARPKPLPSTRRDTREARPTRPITTGPPVQWSWPVRGVTVSVTTRPNGGQGLMMSGALGQEIRAAGNGRVVYTGTGMLGYGQLVIIKHNDTYLSAYGHTRDVRVRENQEVKAGQIIATMGSGPNGDPMLYFEIRVNGRPVDPSAFLPK